jgi:hypothetical protein
MVQFDWKEEIVIKATGFGNRNLTNRCLKKIVQYVIIILKQDK